MDHLKQLIDNCYEERRYYYVGQSVEQGCNHWRNKYVNDPKKQFKGKMNYFLVDDRFQTEAELIKYAKEKDKKMNWTLCRNKMDRSTPKDGTKKIKKRGQVYVVVLCEEWKPSSLKF